MNKYRLLMATLLAAGLALAGCGGGTSQDLATAQEAQRNALEMAAGTLRTALAAVTGNESVTVEQLTAATAALAALKMRLSEAEDLSAEDKARYERDVENAEAQGLEAKRIAAIDQDLKAGEIKAAMDAVALVTDASEESTVTAAEAAIAAAEKAVEGAAIPEVDKAKLRTTLTEQRGMLTGRKAVRMSAMERADAAAADKLMKETVDKLYKRIRRGNDTVYAGADLRLTVDKLEYTLKEDKDTTVAAIKGWNGVKLFVLDSGDTYEAYAYTDIDERGLRTLEDIYPDEYDHETGVLENPPLKGNFQLISPDGFDFTVGPKIYTPASGETEVRIKGVYYSVPGTYICTPTGENQCAARAALASGESGVNVGGVDANGENYNSNRATWTFKADDPGAKVMAAGSDAGFSTYGWWIEKWEDDSQWTAGAFHGRRGGNTRNNNVLSTITGNANYEGGAAGIYAIKAHPLGGSKNDAGHFVADARLEANFTTNKIKGTIDNFRTGNLGTSPEKERDWSVELMQKGFEDGQLVNHISGENDKTTKWTIDGVAGLATGGWFGGFAQARDSSSPQSVITGQFYSTYHGVGKIVGGFGANIVPEQ